MTGRYEIVDARPWHAGQMARRLRIGHRLAAEKSGANLHRELRRCLDESSWSKAFLLDGEMIALGGVLSSLLSSVGYVWLAMTDEATRHPFALVREARRQLDSLSETFDELATTVLAEDDDARRFAIFLGFHVGHDGPGEQATTRAGRGFLNRYLDTCDERIVYVGGARAIAVGYHREAP